MAAKTDWSTGNDVTATQLNNLGSEVNGKEAAGAASTAVSGHESTYDHARFADAAHTHGVDTLPGLIGGFSVETATGVWTVDPPSRPEGETPFVFVGLSATSNPKDATTGVDTPENVNDTDIVVRPSA